MTDVEPEEEWARTDQQRLLALRWRVDGMRREIDMRREADLDKIARVGDATTRLAQEAAAFRDDVTHRFEIVMGAINDMNTGVRAMDGNFKSLQDDIRAGERESVAVAKARAEEDERQRQLAADRLTKARDREQRNGNIRTAIIATLGVGVSLWLGLRGPSVVHVNVPPTTTTTTAALRSATIDPVTTTTMSPRAVHSH